MASRIVESSSDYDNVNGIRGHRGTGHHHNLGHHYGPRPISRFLSFNDHHRREDDIELKRIRRVGNMDKMSAEVTPPPDYDVSRNNSGRGRKLGGIGRGNRLGRANAFDRGGNDFERDIIGRVGRGGGNEHVFGRDTEEGAVLERSNSMEGSALFYLGDRGNKERSSDRMLGRCSSQLGRSSDNSLLGSNSNLRGSDARVNRPVSQLAKVLEDRPSNDGRTERGEHLGVSGAYRDVAPSDMDISRHYRRGISDQGVIELEGKCSRLISGPRGANSELNITGRTFDCDLGFNRKLQRGNSENNFVRGQNGRSSDVSLGRLQKSNFSEGENRNHSFVNGVRNHSFINEATDVELSDVGSNLDLIERERRNERMLGRLSRTGNNQSNWISRDGGVDGAGSSQKPTRDESENNVMRGPNGSSLAMSRTSLNHADSTSKLVGVTSSDSMKDDLLGNRSKLMEEIENGFKNRKRQQTQSDLGHLTSSNMRNRVGDGEYDNFSPNFKYRQFRDSSRSLQSPGTSFRNDEQRQNGRKPTNDRKSQNDESEKEPVGTGLRIFELDNVIKSLVTRTESGHIKRSEPPNLVRSESEYTVKKDPPNVNRTASEYVKRPERPAPPKNILRSAPQRPDPPKILRPGSDFGKRPETTLQGGRVYSSNNKAKIRREDSVTSVSSLIHESDAEDSKSNANESGSTIEPGESSGAMSRNRGYRPNAPPQYHQVIYHQRSDQSDRRFEIRRLPESRRALPPPKNYISPTVKCLLFSFNFLFWMIGMSIAGLGFWISIEKDRAVRDVLDLLFDPSVLMCFAGVIIFSLGFFGCLGALRENICLLKMFHLSLTLLLTLELLLAVAVFVFYFVPSVRAEVGWDPAATLKAAIVRYRDDDDLRDLIDGIQKEFSCCGFSNDDSGYLDWQHNVYFNCTADNPSVERCGVPHSCCVVAEGQMLNVMCGFDTARRARAELAGVVHTRGCLKGFGSFIETHAIVIGVACVGVTLPQLLGICLSRSLIGQINQQKAQWKLTG